MDKIVVMRGGAIGDFLLTLPVIAALKRHFPGARLEILGYPHIASLAVAGGLADQVQPVESPTLAGFFASDAALDPGWCRLFSETNLCVSFLHDPNRIFEGNVKRASHARFLCGPHRPNESANLHATNVFLKALESIGIHQADPVPHLHIPASTELKWMAGNWIAFHPGSGSVHKNWLPERWIQLVERVIKETNWRILLVGGEAEAERLNELSDPFSSERVTHAIQLPLPQLAQMLFQCRLFLGHDSGISHLAAALGLPGLALWGPTNPNIWRPRSQEFEILSSETGLNGLSVNEVYEHLERKWQSLQQRKTPFASLS